MSVVCNAIRTARYAANLSLEQASEQFDVSVATLAAYETGKRKVPDDIIARAIHVYRAPEIAGARITDFVSRIFIESEVLEERKNHQAVGAAGGGFKKYF